MRNLALALILLAAPCLSLGQASSSKVTFTVNNPVPTITSLSPSSIPTGSAATLLTITGTNFNSSTTLSLGATSLPITTLTPTSITTTIPSTSLSAPSSLTLTATNPTPGGGVASSTFVVSIPPPPIPTITAIVPTFTLAGSPDLSILFSGTDYQSNATAYFQGPIGNPIPLSTTFTSSTSLTATIPAAQLSTAGTYSLYVTNPGGVLAHTVTLTFTASTTPAAGTLILRGVTTGGPYTLLTPTALDSTITSYQDTTIQNGKTYFYVGQAVLNGVQSAISNELSAVIPN